MELKVHAGSADPSFLEGKYSESFISELERQITLVIEDAMGVSGLDGSTLRLELIFAPGTYMEHTSDNVTYRRLLLSDKSCQARDFWVKWTRLDGAVAYTVSDEVSAETIKFELGEDVPQKIREREFRFLCSGNPDKYQSAMGKKTVTEWRELIKRAIRRGDIVKLESELSEVARCDDVQDKLLEVLEAYGKPVEIEEHGEDTAQSFDSIMELARAALGNESAKEEVPEEALDETLNEWNEPEQALDEWSEPEEEMLNEECEDELPWWGGESLDLGEESDAESLEYDNSSDDTYMASDDLEDKDPAAVDTDIPEVTEEEKEAEEAPTLYAPEPEEESLGDEFERGAPHVPTEEEIRREIEARVRRELEEKIRLEYEERERARRFEIEETKRAEEERLRRENERLAEMARIAEAERAREAAERNALEEQKKKEAEELRIRLAAQAEREARERDRLAAEVARRAVIAERERELEERARLDEERRAEEEPKLPEAPVLREPEPPAVEYLAKHAKLMFRRTADLNVIPRIKEIIENTLVAEGKETLPLYIKAFPIDELTIGLDILRIPEGERDLLVKMMRAIGNGGLGIIKITVE